MTHAGTRAEGSVKDARNFTWFSLRWKLLVPSLALLFALIVGLSAYWSDRHTSQLEADFLRTIEVGEGFIVPGVVDAVWDYNQEQVGTILTGLLRFEPFVHARVVSEDGSDFAEISRRVEDPASSVGEQGKTDPADQTLKKVRTPLLHPDGGAIGVLETRYSRATITTQIADARLTAACIGLVAFILFSVLLSLIAQSVTAPVSRIARQLKRLENGERGFPIADDRRRDEIGVLARAVGSFHDTLEEAERLAAERNAARTARQARESERDRKEQELRSVRAEAAAAAATAERDRVEAERSFAARQADERHKHLLAQQRVVEALRHGLAALAAGDLNFSLDTQFPREFEDLRTDFNVAMSQLRSAIQESRHSIAGMSGVTKTISGVVQQLTARAQGHAVALAKSSDAISNLADTAVETARAAETVRGMAEKARTKADAGAELALSAVATISDMEAGSKQIAEITHFIDEIAFQTNLLSLNAAVEAARAGPAGRGFAVVATEVRALSNKTTAASREIGEIIDRASAAVGRTSIMVRETGSSMSALVDLARRITEEIDEIAGKMADQADWTGRLDGNLSDLDKQTQASARTFAELDGSIRSLAGDAVTLEREMKRFDVDDRVKRQA